MTATWYFRADHITSCFEKKKNAVDFFYIEMISYHKIFIGVKRVEFEL